MESINTSEEPRVSISFNGKELSLILAALKQVDSDFWFRLNWDEDPKALADRIRHTAQNHNLRIATEQQKLKRKKKT